MDMLGRVIVSCTTTQRRLRYLHFALESLRFQTLAPDTVILNISKGPYLSDQGIDELPSWLNQHDIEVRWVPNIGSYRKLIPTLQDAEELDLVITMDDDILFGPHWVEWLVKKAVEYPHAIVAARARQLRRTLFGGWRNYRSWRLIDTPMVGDMILPTGGAGVVYRKNLMNMDFLSDPAFLQLAPTSDDLWFRMASLLKGSPVVVAPSINFDNTFLTHELGLQQLNFRRFSRNWQRVVFGGFGGAIKSGLGINETKNDFAWDSICHYARWTASSVNY